MSWKLGRSDSIYSFHLNKFVVLVNLQQCINFYSYQVAAKEESIF